MPDYQISNDTKKNPQGNTGYIDINRYRKTDSVRRSFIGIKQSNNTGTTSAIRPAGNDFFRKNTGQSAAPNKNVRYSTTGASRRKGIFAYNNNNSAVLKNTPKLRNTAASFNKTFTGARQIVPIKGDILHRDRSLSMHSPSSKVPEGPRLCFRIRVKKSVVRLYFSESPKRPSPG